jgi:DNA-binding beta-propeller fold protein YncE
MKRPSVLFISLLLLALALPAQAWIRSPATTFATLPPGVTTPEGLTVDPVSGDVYVTAFGFPESGPATIPQIAVFDQQGKFLRTLTLTASGNLAVSPHLLGLAFHPATHALLVLDFGGKNVLNVDPSTGAATAFSLIGGNAGLNALTFDSAGFVYVSDSFQGIIWKIPPAGGPATQWIQHPLLTTTGVPPFGANGIAFNNAGTILFVANTGDDSVVQIPVSGGAVAGTPTVFAYSINGADGLIVDSSDNVWICANQSDEIVVLNPSGKVIAKLGDFDGIDNQGAVRGLLFPASLAFSGNFLLVTNLALDLSMPGFGFPTIDAQWAAQVKTFTVSKINRHLPPISPSTAGHGQQGQGQGRGH